MIDANTGVVPCQEEPFPCIPAAMVTMGQAYQGDSFNSNSLFQTVTGSVKLTTHVHLVTRP
jgi:hypothetical protein